MYKEGAKGIGQITVRLYGTDGRLKYYKHIRNVLTNTGFAAHAKRLVGVTQNAFDYIAVGTDATAASASQTALLAEIADSGLSRAQDGTTTVETTTQTDDTGNVGVTFNITGSKTITEYGLFNDSSAGVMLARQTDTALPVINGETLAVTWKIQELA